MPDEPAIACSLDSTDLSERLREMARLGAESLIESRTEGARAELRFAGGRGIRERVEAIAAAESQCCPFLTMHVGEEAGAVVLRVSGPLGTDLVLTELVDAFTGRRAGTT